MVFGLRGCYIFCKITINIFNVFCCPKIFDKSKIFTFSFCSSFSGSCWEELQEDVNKWLNEYNSNRTHTGRYCYGKTPIQTFAAAKHMAQEKMIGEAKFPFKSKKENELEVEVVEIVTTSELEGVR